MQKRNVINLALAGLVTVLALAVLLAPEDEPPPKPPLTPPKQSDIERLEITRPRQPGVVLVREDGAWFLEEPWPVWANAFKVESLLRLAETPSLARYEMKDLDPARFGLDAPLATVNFNDSVTLEFGNSEPVNQRRYVRAGDTLHLITDTFYWQLGAKAHTFVGHGLVPPNAAVTGLELPGLRLSLEKGAWQVTPAPGEAAADRAQALVDEWKNAQALEVRPADKADPKGSRAVTVHLEGAPAIRYRLVQDEDRDEVRLVRPDLGLAWVLAAEPAERLLKLPPPPKALQAEGDGTPAAKEQTDDTVQESGDAGSRHK